MLFLSSSHATTTTLALHSDAIAAVPSNGSDPTTLAMTEEATLESLAPDLEHSMTERNVLKLAERHHESNDGTKQDDANLI